MSAGAGADAKRELSMEEIEELRMISAFNVPDLKRLWVKFQDFGGDEHRGLSSADFLLIPAVALSPLAAVVKMKDQRLAPSATSNLLPLFKAVVRLHCPPACDPFSPVVHDAMMIALLGFHEHSGRPGWMRSRA